MPKLMLVKHSLPAIVPGIPARDWHLNDVGRERCLELAEQLKPHQLEIIITSHEPKAAETGRIVAKQLQLPCSEADDLHEHERSNEHYVDQATFQAKVRAFFDQPAALVYGLETANQAHSRFAGAVTQLQQTYPHQNLVIVAHGTVISLYVSRLLKLDPYALWSELGLPALIVLNENRITARWSSQP